MANGRATVAETAARQLANATKTRAQWGGITPRWLIPFLPWTPVEAGIFRLNRVKQTRGATAVSSDDVESSPPRDEDPDLPETFVDYEEHPREYFLSAITTVLDVQTRVSDLYSRPFDQIQEQLRLLIEKVKETHESELINNPEYGLLASAAPSMTIPTRNGAPTPDDLDELIARVWKEPAFFLAHPAAIAAFGRECTRRGVPPPTVNLFGSPFLTWRGLPLVPSDKVPLERGTSKIRSGRRKEAGRGRPVPARRPGRGLAQPFGPLHGHQPQGDRVLSRVTLQLARRADRGCAWRARYRLAVGKYHAYDHTYGKGGGAIATSSRARTRKRS